MRNIILNRLLLFSMLAATIVSCSEQEPSTSVQTNFALLTPQFTANTVQEIDGVQTLNVTLSGETQVTDMHVTIGVGASSTATEGEDFDLLTHEVDLAAFEGQDGFDIEIEVYDDNELDEGTEEIYLTVTTETPSGLAKTDILFVTIEACTVPFDDTMFSGAYNLSSTNGPFGAPLFNDQTVTLDVVAGRTRAFDAAYLEALGIGNAAQTWFLEFDCDDNLMHFEEQAANLSCNAGGIFIEPLAPFGTFDTADDSQFTVVITEFEPVEDADWCALDGTAAVTLTFTKL